MNDHNALSFQVRSLSLQAKAGSPGSKVQKVVDMKLQR